MVQLDKIKKTYSPSTRQFIALFKYVNTTVFKLQWDFVPQYVQIKFKRHQWAVIMGNALSFYLLHLSCSLQWCHNEHDGISNHQPHDCLLNRLLRCRSKLTSKLCVTGFCEGNSLVNSLHKGASKAENVSIWGRLHVELLSWYPIVHSSLCNPFKDWSPIDFIHMCRFFK